MVVSKSLSLIPGPKGWPLLGTLPHYVLPNGIYSFDTLHLNGLKKYQKYGSVVHEEIVPGTSIIWLYRPEDIQTMFATEGKYPSRRSHLALEKYRLDNPHIFGNAGLLPTNGPEWARIRKSFQFKPKAVDTILPKMHSASMDLVHSLKQRIRRGNEVFDILEDLEKFFLEITTLFLFNLRLNANCGFENRRAEMLMRSSSQTNDNILKTDNGLPLWNYIDTKSYKQIKEGQGNIAKIAQELIDENEIVFPFRDENIGHKDILTFVSDMLLAGIHTSAFSTGFLIYHLATNKDEQEKLRSSCVHELKSLQDFPYGQLVLKESLRLNPISVGVSRISGQDAQFSGYSIPKGTLLVSQNQVSCRLADYFDRPDSFVPERWSGNHHRHQYHPYLSLPFGYGKRMCIGRRLAERSILVVMNQLIRHFDFTWASKEALGCKSILINRPDKPLVFKIKPIID